MGHTKHRDDISLVGQASARLAACYASGKGRSKRADKAAEMTVDRIYSTSTLQTYLKHACYFVKWCKEYPPARDKLGHKPRTLEECRPFVADWMATRANLSAWTQKLEISALAKLYGCHAADLDIKTPPRRRRDIKRSRMQTTADRHFSEAAHIEILNFGKCTGLRRRELGQIRGDALCWKDGRPYLHVTDGTKGRRERYAPIIGQPEAVQDVVRRCQKAGKSRVWPQGAPKNMDEHACRAFYAKTVYEAYARPIGGHNGISGHDVYYCRGDFAGRSFDRAAMLKASEALGHSRVSVIASHYLWPIQD